MYELESLEEFNELFEKINNKDKKSYFKGSRFINVIKEFKPSFPSYSQYLQYRKTKGLSQSRKDYFYEILHSFDEETREVIFTRIHQIIEESERGEDTVIEQVPFANIVENPFETKAVEEPTIDSVHEETQTIDEVIVEENFVYIEEPTLLHFKTQKNPRVFISYSWDDEPHKEWVLKLSIDLRERGIETILDRYFLRSGVNASVFMEQAMEEADKVLIIFTEQYKDKASGRTGGVGIEYSMMNIDLCRSIAGNTKYIPILRRGNSETSIPLFLQPYIASYMTTDSEYEEKLTELTYAIFNKSVISAPEVGDIPDYIKD